MSIDAPAEAEAMRAAFRQLVWPAGYPADRRPDLVEPYPFEYWTSLPNVRDVRRLIYRQHLGVDTTCYHLRPVVTAGRAMIFNDGHQFGTLTNWVRERLGSLVAAGLDIVYCPLPLYSLDPLAGQTWDDPPRPVVDGVELVSHDQFPPFRTSSFHPLSWFLTPVVGTVNYLADQGRPAPAVMGISGGAQVSLWAAAAEPRIVRTYPVSGVITPGGPTVAIDWEYSDAEIQATAPTADLFVLAADRPGREMRLIMNESDGVFSPGREDQYAPTVTAASAALGGRWSYWIDVGETVHWIGPDALAEILRAQGAAPVPTATPTVTATVSPTATRTPTRTPTAAPAQLPPTPLVLPTRAPTRTPVPAGAWCSAHPPVRVQTQRTGPHSLAVTVTGRAAPLSVAIGFKRNAVVSPPAVSGLVATFTVTRQAPGPAHVPFLVTDGCGRWPTFVGLGE